MKFIWIFMLVGAYFAIGHMWLDWWEQTEVGLYQELKAAVENFQRTITKMLSQEVKDAQARARESQ